MKLYLKQDLTYIFTILCNTYIQQWSLNTKTLYLKLEDQ